MKKFFSAFRLFFVALVFGVVLWLPTQYVLPVVMYHSVGSGQASDLNSVSLESFKKQMDFIKARGYRVLSLDDYIEGLSLRKNFGYKNVVVTFDDGLLDNYMNAYPVLKGHGFPAAMFVPTDKMGMPGRLAWDQLQEMSANKITIGSHLLTETYLPGLTHDEAAKEIVESKKVLEQKLGRPAYYLAYPIGGFNDDVKVICSNAGYKAAFTTNRGYNRRNTDFFELKRIRIKDTDGPWQLWLKLSGYYNLIRADKKPY